MPGSILERLPRAALARLRERRRKERFHRLCDACHLSLDYERNAHGLGIFEEVFGSRFYADYFPFYRESTIVDIGAHFGYFSLFAARNSAAGSRIVALEPCSENFDLLLANLEACGVGNVRAARMGIGGETKRVPLYKHSDQNASIVDGYVLGAPEGEPLLEQIEVCSLPDLFEREGLDRVDFLKMDCEGAEYDALFSTPRDCLDRITTIAMEFHDCKDARRTGLEMTRVLRERGFEIPVFQHLPSGMDLNYGRIVATRYQGAG